MLPIKMAGLSFVDMPVALISRRFDVLNCVHYRHVGHNIALISLHHHLVLSFS